MPHEVIMPALGMAQDSGILVAWLKKPGDPVAEGDALFEVETDKATMEVEAQSAGYLTNVSAGEGEDIPVGRVIALISESAEDSGDTIPAARSETAPEPGDSTTEIPDGTAVIMPALGMAQDSGLILAWHKNPGEAVAAGEVLFEVETDKSAMEIEAGADGYVAALLAEAGEEAPVGATIAVISAEKPATPVRRRYAGTSRSAPEARISPPEAVAPAPAPQPEAMATSATPGPMVPEGRILASPKARRLALEQGLDLARLVAAGHPQPFRVADLEVLRTLPAAADGATGDADRRMTAEAGPQGFADFAAWAATEAGLADEAALLAGFAAAGLGREPAVVAVERFGQTRTYTVPPGPLSGIAPAGEGAAAPGLLVRDLRPPPVARVALGAEAVPVLTLTRTGGGLTVTLECAASHLSADAALTLLTAFAGRIDDPLRHLL